MEKVTDECCPKFHPEKWENKTFNWRNKHFIKTSIPTLFHVPFPSMIGKKVTRMMKAAQDANKAEASIEDTLLLFNDPNPFRSEMYLSVTDDVPKSKNATLSGTFMSKVYDGPYKAIPKFMKDMTAYLSKQHIKAKKYFVHYAYCPKCAKKNNHNYMILFAEV